MSFLPVLWRARAFNNKQGEAEFISSSDRLTHCNTYSTQRPQTKQWLGCRHGNNPARNPDDVIVNISSDLSKYLEQVQYLMKDVTSLIL